MSGNSFGKLFTITSFGESHGPALGAVVDGCPPGLALCEEDLQRDLDRRKPGQSRYTTQRREADQVRILSGVFEGKTTGTPIGLLIENTDQRSKDYSKIKDRFRPWSGTSIRRAATTRASRTSTGRATPTTPTTRATGSGTTAAVAAPRPGKPP